MEKFRYIWGHHYEDKENREFELMLLRLSGYDTAFGMVYVHTYIDEYGQIFQHRTKKEFKVTVYNHYKIEGKVKHGEFRGRKTTYIHNINYLKNE